MTYDVASEPATHARRHRECDSRAPQLVVQMHERKIERHHSALSHLKMRPLAVYWAKNGASTSDSTAGSGMDSACVRKN